MTEQEVRRQLQEMMQDVRGRVTETIGERKEEWLESFKSASTWMLVGAVGCWILRGFSWRSGWGQQFESVAFMGLVLLSFAVDNAAWMRRFCPHRGLANLVIGCFGADYLWSLLMYLARVEN